MGKEMNKNIKAGADIHAGDGGYSVGTKEKHDEFVKGRNQSLGKMQIRELMLGAGTDISGKWMGVDHAEKFAELIIRECAEFANEHNEEVEGVTLGVGQALKKHFGVE